MLFPVMPFSPEKNYGTACNQMMGLLPADGWACIMDHDVLWTTLNWYHQITEIIAAHPLGTFTAVANRIGHPMQREAGAPRTDNLAVHRVYGTEVARRHWGQLLDITDVQPPMSGMVIVLSKANWELAGGFRPQGILGVDNALHLALRAQGRKIWVMRGVYVYHYYRGDRPHDKRHLL